VELFHLRGVLKRIKKEFLLFFSVVNQSIKTRQGYVSTSGKKWEIVVMKFVNQEFIKNNVPLKVLRGRGLKKKYPVLWNNLAIPVNNGCVEGDVDLVVVNLNNIDIPLAVISCKTSLHGRFSETLFYTTIWKQTIPKFIVMFATPDKGRQSKKQWQSEWGSMQKPTKDRQLAEKYIDGVYIDNMQTSLGGKIKKLTDLPLDLKNLLTS